MAFTLILSKIGRYIDILVYCPSSILYLIHVRIVLLLVVSVFNITHDLSITDMSVTGVSIP